ncbi:hypothetical protein APT_10143 (plasmid) [Acetobacter pasteurianus NBRC 101655]|nr:hypothetical protein APT_10143 [Acetobacter pasteurianus NBRC 101655]
MTNPKPLVQHWKNWYRFSGRTLEIAFRHKNYGLSVLAIYHIESGQAVRPPKLSVGSAETEQTGGSRLHLGH